MAIDFAELKTTDAVYYEIGRRYVSLMEFREAIENAIVAPVDFATKATGAGGKKKNCNPSKSHFCQTPNGSGSCVSLKKKCQFTPDAPVAQASNYTGTKSKGKGKAAAAPAQAGAASAPPADQQAQPKVDATPTLKPVSYNPNAIPDLEPKAFAEFRSDREFLKNQDDPEEVWNKSAADAGMTKAAFRNRIAAAITAGFVPSDEALADAKLTKAQQQQLQANQAALQEKRSRVQQIQAAIDHPLMDDSEASGYKPRMSRDEADAYSQGSFAGNLSFYHGNPTAMVDDMANNGIKPDLNNRGLFGKGAYFATSREVAELYALGSMPLEPGPDDTSSASVIEVRTRVKNPYVMNSTDIANAGSFFPGSQDNNVDSTAITEFARAKGHDSIYLADKGYFITFDQRQTVVVDKEDMPTNSPRMQSIRDYWWGENKAERATITHEESRSRDSDTFKALAGASRSENRTFEPASDDDEFDF